MAIEIDKMFTVNEDSLKHSLEILIDQRLNFRPISKEKYKEIIKVDMSDIPFDGTLIERNEFIDKTLDKLIDKAIKENKIKVLDEDQDNESNDSSDSENIETKIEDNTVISEENNQIVDETITNVNFI